MNDTVHNLIIIGSGPAGLTAGIYAARGNIMPIIIDGPTPGGQLISTSYVENWPGEQRILGPELMKRMREHAEHFGCTFLDGAITAVDFSKQPFTLTLDSNKTLKARSIIIASGASPKRLGVPGEDTYWGKGVTTCAVCDGALYKDKRIIIVGGGDTAMEDASFMTKFASDITIIHILDKLTASHAMQQRVLNNKNIKIVYSSTVTEIRGTKERITDVVVTDSTSKKQTTLPADAVFIAIGLNPNTKPYENQLELLKNGYIKVTNGTHTSVPGVFVAGDVADFRYRQAVTSAGTGCMAALDAERYLADL